MAEGWPVEVIYDASVSSSLFNMSCPGVGRVGVLRPADGAMTFLSVAVSTLSAASWSRRCMH